VRTIFDPTTSSDDDSKFGTSPLLIRGDEKKKQVKTQSASKGSANKKSALRTPVKTPTSTQKSLSPINGVTPTKKKNNEEQSVRRKRHSDSRESSETDISIRLSN
jgi:hypothetical protein